MFEKRLQEIEARKLEIRGLLEGDNQDLNLDELDQELRNLDTEVQDIERRKTIAAGIAAGKVEPNPIAPPAAQKRSVTEMNHEELLDSPEYRSAFLKNLQGKALNEEEQRALTTGSNSAGAAVPKTTLNKVIEKLRQTSVLFREITVSYIPGNLSLVVANAKNAASWKAEGADGVPVEDTVVSVNLAGYELIKLVEISAAAQVMTIDAFENYISSELGKQMAIALENAIVSGSGDGQPLGILNGVAWTPGVNEIEWAADKKVDYDTLVDGIAALPTMYHNNACFCMNRKMLFSGIRKIKTTYGEPIFTYNAQDPVKNSILGYPVILNDYAPDDTILFCDHSYYYMNFSNAPTIEADRSVGFKSGKITYRGLAVVDGKPALAEAFVKIAKAQA